MTSTSTPLSPSGMHSTHIGSSLAFGEAAAQQVAWRGCSAMLEKESAIDAVRESRHCGANLRRKNSGAADSLHTARKLFPSMRHRGGRARACVLTSALVLAAALLALHPGVIKREVQRQVLARAPLIAISISGAARGPDALRRFADGLLRHVVLPARPHLDFEAFAWLQDDESEALLESLLCSNGATTAIRRCLSRRSQRPAPTQEDEATTIAREHPPAAYDERAWSDAVTPNTLKMLYKLRAVERLRLHHTMPSEAPSHILRIRPDLELQATLPLPPPVEAAEAVLTPWLCTRAQLSSDQLLLLPVSSGASAALAGLYETAMLRRAMGQSDPPSLYPERLVYHALRGHGLRIWQVSDGPALHELGAGGAPRHPGLVLIGADGGVRDPYAKLKRDFPDCAYGSAPQR